jgi:DNA-binding PadR family transcriptional regulator
MPTSLGYAILALVATKPQSGYDIARQMKLPLGYFWQAKHSQIYPELARMQKRGLVEFTQVDQKTRPARKVYSVTEAGKSALAEWVAAPPQERPSNDEIVVKAYSLARIPAASSAALIRSQMRTHDERLGVLEQRTAALEARAQTRTARAGNRFGEYAALRRAIGIEREYLAWCRWLLSELKRTEGKSRTRR